MLADEANSMEGSEHLLPFILKELALINGKINAMDERRLRFKLNKYNLPIDGDDAAQRKRLKYFYKKVHLASIGLLVHDQLLPYYVVVDFEATCESENPQNYKHEIIEFPAILVNGKTLKVEDTFRRICRPTLKPNLSEFCKELTGISQEEINSAQTFSEVLKDFESWLKKHKLGTVNKFALVTDGPFDVVRFLFVQCFISNIELPVWARTWVNIRKIFRNFYSQKQANLSFMLEFYKMSFVGRLHCGLDDASNIAKILIRLICDGANIQVNERISIESLEKCARLRERLLQEDEVDLFNKVTLEGEKQPIVSNTTPTYKKVKGERCKNIKKLAKEFATEALNETEIQSSLDDININAEESDENCTIPTKEHRQRNAKIKKGKRKK